jgi:basic amino acid/polyamine antiporter, APA family
MFKKHKREALTLRRDLGLFDATLAGVGIIVGAGIYVLIGTAAGYAGNAVWISFIISAIVAFLTGLSYAELSSIYCKDSGEYCYVEHNFGKSIAFVTGYLVMLALVLGAAAVSLGFSGYLNTLMNFGNVTILAIFSILLFTVINITGIKASMKLTIVLTGLSVLGLLIVIFFTVPKIGSVNYFEMINLSGVFKAASLIFFAFIGFESVVKLSEETVNPRKTIPLALLLSIGISTILYVLVAISAVSTLGWKQLAASSAPLTDVMTAAMGSNAGHIVTIIAIVSTGNTILLSLIAMSRMVYSMCKDYKKLRIFSKINSFTKTPLNAILVSTGITILFVLVGNLRVVAEITNYFVFVVFAVINLALIKSRYVKHRHEMFHEPFNLGKFPLLALLGFMSTVFLMLNLEKIVLLLGSILTGIGFLIYGFTVKR